MTSRTVNRRIHDGPSSDDERGRQAVEQCIARRWTDFMLTIAEETHVNLLDVLKYAREQQARANAVDGGGSPTNRGPKEAARRQPCGTVSAYERHRRHYEEPCQPCKDAHHEYNLIRRQRRRNTTTKLNGQPA